MQLQWLYGLRLLPTQLFTFSYTKIFSQTRRVCGGEIALSVIGRLPPAHFTTSSIKKLHVKSLCFYPDVVCRRQEYDETNNSNHPTKLAGLYSAHHPCLVKQWQAKAETAFNIPILNGLLSLAGECHPLKPLAKLLGKRSLSELYVTYYGGTS
jgi:hypothetical protein